MKDSKQIRKVLFVNKSNIALVVMNNVDNDNNILFASQVNVDNADIQVKISDLLTNAANFLGFNIKDLQLIFADDQISRLQYTNEEFYDCTCEEDIAKEIFKRAKVKNYFVNEINFMGVKYDEYNKIATVNAQVCSSSYITYKEYVNAVRKCNVVITKSTNIYKLIKGNKEQIELTLDFADDKVVACEYYGNKLHNVSNIELNLPEIKQHLADRYNISLNKVEDVLKVANQLAAGNELDANVVNNYDLKTKSYINVKVNDVLALYRDEVKNQINNFVDFRNFQSIRVISKDAINNLEDCDIAINNEIGFDNVALDKIVCLANVDSNQELDQFSFENKLSGLGRVVA